MAGGEFCTNCGARRSGEGRFCASCGHAYEVPPAKASSGLDQPATEGDRSTGARRGVVVAVLGVAVLLVAVVAVLAMSGSWPWSSNDEADGLDMVDEPELQWTFDVEAQLTEDGVAQGSVRGSSVRHLGDDMIAVAPWGSLGAEGVAHIYGVDSDSGELVWTSPLDLGEGTFWSSCLDAIDGTLPCLVSLTQQGEVGVRLVVVGLDAGDGGLRWDYELAADDYTSIDIQAVGGDDVIVASHGNDPGESFMARLSASTGEETWATRAETDLFVVEQSNMVVSEPYISVGNVVLHADTGETLLPQGGADARFTVVDGAIIRHLYAEDGVVVERLDEDGRSVWSATRQGDFMLPYDSHVTDRVLIASGDSSVLTAVDVDTGEDMWSTMITPEETEKGGPRGVRSADSMILGSSESADTAETPHLRAIDLETGQQVWRRSVDVAFSSSVELDSLRIGERQLYVLDEQGDLVASDLDSGKETWRVPLPEDASQLGLEVAGDRFFILSGSKVWALG